MTKNTPTKDRFEEDCLQEYLNEIADHKILTREEEVSLFQRLHAGEVTAREELITCNLRLVVKIALQYKNLGVPVSDLIQEGNIGLMTVIQKFDETRGFRFSTYAAFWIRQEIQNCLRNNGSMIRLPVRKARLMGKINDAIRSFNTMEGRDPSIEEIGSFLGIEKEKVAALLPLREGVISIDAEYNDEGGNLLSTIVSEVASPSDRICRAQLKKTVSTALEGLTEREREIVELRFGFRNGASMSLRKTSAKVGLSQEGVRRVEQRALDKLRRPAVAQTLEPLMIA